MSPRTKSTPFEASGQNTTVPGLPHYRPRHVPQAMNVPCFPSSAPDASGLSEANFSLSSRLPSRSLYQQAAVASWVDTTGEAEFDPSSYLTDEALSFPETQSQPPVTTTAPFPGEPNTCPQEGSRRLSSAASTFDFGDYSQPVSSTLDSSPYQRGLPFLSHESSMSCSEAFDPCTLTAFDDSAPSLEPESGLFTSPTDQTSHSFAGDEYVTGDLQFEAGQPQDLFAGSSSGESSYPSPPEEDFARWNNGPVQPQPCRTFSVPMHSGNPASRQLVSPPLSEPNGGASLFPSSTPFAPSLEAQYQSMTSSYAPYGQPITFCDPMLSVPNAHNAASATVRASRPMHRPILSAMDRKPSPPFDRQKPRGHHGMPEIIPPRNNPLYKQGPKDDGLYHCPFLKEKDCGHKPTPQKCAYEPYRCKDEKCAQLEFSSNACLFRHEREAHGMHGHGDNPHSCIFPDCDRSKPGQGFPRRWNLWDHMKRVHDYNAAEEEKKTAAPKQTSRNSGVRKRKTSNGPTASSVSMKRSTSSQSKAQAKSAAVIQAQNTRRLQETRQNASNVKNRLMDQIQSLDITNQDDIALANASLQELQTYQYEFRQLQPFGFETLDMQYSG
ncbi:MAG: hypothetical protein Q9227_003881 [Pyrenula ochraceoflavens]